MSSNGQARQRSDPVAGTPRWVKALGVIALVLVLAVVIVLLTGRGGSHGPSRHTPSGDTGAPPAGAQPRP